MSSMTTSTPTVTTDLSRLSQAVQDGDSKRVKRRLSKLFGDNINQGSGKYLWTPLMWALGYGHLHIARLLMREWADVTLKTSRGGNSIHASIKSKQVGVTLWAMEQCAAKGVGINDQDDFAEEEKNAFDDLS